MASIPRTGRSSRMPPSSVRASRRRAGRVWARIRRLEPRCATSSGAILTSRRDPRSPERGQYVRPGAHPRGRLRHPVETRPARRHLAAARYFEALGDDELAGVLATPLPRGLSRGTRGPRGRGGRGPGPSRAARRCRASGRPPLARSCPGISRAGPFPLSPDATEDAELLERAGNAASEAHGRHDAARNALDARDRPLPKPSGSESACSARTAAPLRLAGFVPPSVGQTKIDPAHRDVTGQATEE